MEGYRELQQQLLGFQLEVRNQLCRIERLIEQRTNSNSTQGYQLYEEQKSSAAVNSVASTSLTGPSSQEKTSLICNFCRKPGHTIAECRRKY